MQRSGYLTREVLLEFFKRGQATFNDPDFQASLKQAHTTGTHAPEQLINQAQKAIFHALEVDGEWGLQQLRHVRQQYANDQELTTQFFAFVEREEMALDEAELSPEEFLGRLMQRQSEATARENMMKMYEGLTPEQQQMMMQVAQGIGLAINAKMQTMSHDEKIAAMKEQSEWETQAVQQPPQERMLVFQRRLQALQNAITKSAPDAAAQRMER